jgi:hypothetical protein
VVRRDRALTPPVLTAVTLTAMIDFPMP